MPGLSVQPVGYLSQFDSFDPPPLPLNESPRNSLKSGTFLRVFCKDALGSKDSEYIKFVLIRPVQCAPMEDK